MNDKLLKKCDLFIENSKIMKEHFIFEYIYTHYMGALLYCDKNINVNPDSIKNAKKIIKDNTGFFSPFKGTTYTLIAIMVSLLNNPEDYFIKAVRLYDKLKENGFRASDYLAVSSLIMSSRVVENDFERVINRSQDFYRSMKRDHPFLTTAGDYGFAIMLGMSDLPINQTMEDMEKVYKLIKGDFFSSDSVQSLSHVLSFGKDNAQSKYDRVMNLFNSLKEKGYKYGTSYELPSLGVLAIIPDDIEFLANGIIEVYDYLKKEKTFGILDGGKRQQLMYAATLVSQEYVDDFTQDTMKITLATSMTNIIIATQTAVMVSAISASTAASSSN